VKTRDLLLAVAAGFLAFIAAATALWLKSAAGLGPAIAGSWRTATSDWMVLLFLCDGLIFGTICIAAMGWDLRREPRRCAAWVLSALVIGSPVVLLYVWKAKRGGSLAAPAP
jgi:hypothetical protein